MPAATLVLVDRRPDGVALVTLNRPEKRNALSIELRVELAATLRDLAGDDDVGIVVLAGAGSAFCSGMDTTQFGGDRAHRERLVETSVELFDAVGRCPIPTLAAVNGPALAGGFALALVCDLRIASAAARFGFPELGRHIPPSYAAATSALPASTARDLCLTGRVVDAGEALELGIVSRIAELDGALETATAVAAAPRAATREIKRRILAERYHLWGPVFAEEEKALREALLG